MIWVILSGALLIRLVNLDQSLWLDEAISSMAFKTYSLWSIVTEYAKADFHPPLYFAMMWVWTRVFGFSEIALRMPSVIFGTLTVAAVYFLGRELFSKRAGLFASLLLALNPLHIYYSQEARMYALAAFFATLNMFFFARMLRRPAGFNTGYFTSLLLTLASDYMAGFVVLAQIVIMAVQRSRPLFLCWVKSSAPVFLFSLLWLPIFWSQLRIGVSASSSIPGWRDVVGSFGPKPLILTFVKFIIGRISHPEKLVYLLAFFPVGSVYAFLFIRGLKFDASKRALLAAYIFVPALSAWTLSLILPVYSYFRMLFLLPPFLLIVGAGLLSVGERTRTVLAFFIITAALVCVSFYVFYPKFQREDWKRAWEFIHKGGGVVVFESTGSFAPFEYYSRGKVEVFGGLKKIPASEPKDVSDLEKISGKVSVYYFDYLADITDPKRLLLLKLSELGYREGRVYDFAGVGFVRELHLEGTP